MLLANRLCHGLQNSSMNRWFLLANFWGLCWWFGKDLNRWNRFILTGFCLICRVS